MPQSNYHYTLEQAQQLFLCYDQSAIIKKLRLDHDDAYLYVPLLGQTYRIERKTGRMEWLDYEGLPHPADFNDGMSIYDILCYSKPDARLSGQFALISNITNTFHSSGLGSTFFQSYAPYFAENAALLEKACIALGGVKDPLGDVSYRLDVFPFLPILVRSWAADEDFPPSLQLLWDTNTLQFLHYETTYYLAEHLLDRLKALMEELSAGPETA